MTCPLSINEIPYEFLLAICKLVIYDIIVNISKHYLIKLLYVNLPLNPIYFIQY